MLDLTWDQIQLVAACVVEYRSFQINTIMEIVAGAVGGNVESNAAVTGRKRRKAAKKKKSNKTDTAAQFAALGLPVSTQGAT